MAERSGVRDTDSIHINVCQLCGAFENLLMCGGCKITWYCSKEHQKSDWREHKRECKYKTINHVTAKATIKGIPIKVTTNNTTDKKKKEQSDCTTESLKEKTAALNVKDSEEQYLKLDSTKTTTGTEQGSSEDYILRSTASKLDPQSYTIGSSEGFGMPPHGAETAAQNYFSVLDARFVQLGEYVIKSMNEYGMCVIDKFLGETKGSEILQEIKSLYDSGVFDKGQLVNPKTEHFKLIRGDLITWVDGSEKGCRQIRHLISYMDAVISKCGNTLGEYNISGRTKAMVACYPGSGTGYMKHIDNPNRDGRCVTCIYYLNKNWDVQKDGGRLRIFPEGENKIADIEPLFDRLLFFWSDRRNPHEVQAANKTRFAITVWYYDADERRDAIKRFKRHNNASTLR